ncbi:MAG TPA: amidase family protein, partial [Stellaceae bacterium]
IPRDGATPLSTTLDSIGPLGNSVPCCAIADAVLAGEPAVPPPPVPLAVQRLGVPQTLVLDDLEPAVATAFERACAALSRAGARLQDVPLDELGEYAAINAKGGFSPPEAYAWHAALLARRGGDYDPRVRVRIERGRAMSAADYVTLCWQRVDFIARVDSRTAELDALLLPTVPIIAPPIAAFDKDDDYWRLNMRILRNTAIVNFLDRCAVSVPIHPPGTPPVGLMIVGRHGDDRRLLGMAMALEATLARDRWR